MTCGLTTPSPPAEKATARQDQARQSSTGDGAGDIHRGCSKGIIELEATGDLTCYQIENQFDICRTARIKTNVDRIVGEKCLRVYKGSQRSLVS
jgi:hypothetical protein